MIISRSALCSLLLVCSFWSTACSQTPPGAHVDPALSTLVPADTILLSDIWVEQLVKTPLYQRYLANRPLPQLDQFAEQVGLDVRKDLWEVLLISNGKSTAILGRGRISDESEPRLKIEEQGAKRFSYRGYTMVGDDQNAVLLMGPSMAGVGQTDMLKAILDTRDKTNGPPAVLAERMKEIKPEDQFWMVSKGTPAVLPANLKGNLANLANVLSLIDSGSVSFDLRVGVSGLATGITRDEAAGQQLQSALRGLIGIGRMSTPPERTEVLKLFDGIRVTQEANRVNFYIDEPEEAVDELIKFVGQAGILPNPAGR